MRRLGLWFIRTVLSVVLLYLTVALAWSLMLLPLATDRRHAMAPVAIGFLAGIVAFTLVVRLSLLYVLSHELTHWATAKLFLRRTGPIRVGSSGGSVPIEHPNIAIALAPYVVPFYTLIWIGLYGFYNLVTSTLVKSAMTFLYGKVIDRTFFAGLGVTYAFHVVLTLFALSREQQDLKPYGRFFGLAVILFANVLLLYAAAVIAGASWNEAFALPRQRCERLWELTAPAWNQVRELADFRLPRSPPAPP